MCASVRARARTLDNQLLTTVARGYLDHLQILAVPKHACALHVEMRQRCEDVPGIRDARSVVPSTVASTIRVMTRHAPSPSEPDVVRADSHARALGARSFLPDSRAEWKHGWKSHLFFFLCSRAPETDRVGLRTMIGILPASHPVRNDLWFRRDCNGTVSEAVEKFDVPSG